MAKLETETRNCINDFYNNKIKKLEIEKNRFKEEFIKKCIEEFKNSDKVRIIKDYFSSLIKEYPNYKLDLECKIMEGSYYGTDFPYYEEIEYKKLMKKIENLQNERRKLIVTLESNIKGSREYKLAMNKFINNLEKEGK